MCVARAVDLAAPGEVAFALSVLVLHITLAPAPQPVEDVFLAELYGNHHAVGHAFGAGVVVLHVGDIAHGVAHLEVYLVGATEHIVEHFLQFSVDVGLSVAHLGEEVTILAGFERAFLPRRKSRCMDGKYQQGCHENRFLHHFCVALSMSIGL